MNAEKDFTMARIDQVKEEIALWKLKLGFSAATYIGIMGWSVEKIVNGKILHIPVYVSLSAVVLLILLAFYMPVCEYYIRKKIKELGVIP